MLRYRNLYNKPLALPSLDDQFIRQMSEKPNNESDIISFFNQPITILSSVGAKTQNNLMRLCGSKVQDLLFHMPTKAIDRKAVTAIDPEIHQDEIISFEAHVGRHLNPRSPKAPYRVIVHTDATQGPIEVHLVFFRANPDYIRNLLPQDSRRLISGKLEMFDQQPQMVHPEYVVALDQKHELPQMQPLYHLTAGVTQRLISKAIKEVTDKIPDCPEWHRSELLERHGWVSFSESLKRIHTPQDKIDALPDSKYRTRLAYDAILAHQLTLAIKRAQRQKQYAISISHQHQLANQIVKNLPFSLTGDQKKVLNEIYADLQKPQQMSRMVQGDVGSGKTIVALLAASMVIQDKYQAAIMAPTEILARQHFANLQPLCKEVGIRIGILTGKDKASESKKTLHKLQDGQIDLIIGTHALIQEKVTFKNLALGVIDEQHRFGVNQRQALIKKAAPHAHLLLMTATPIPRSLAMAHYGDCDLSLIQEKPPLRKPVVTRVMPEGKISEIMYSLQRVIDSQGRAYWVCPLVEESEKMDLMAAEERFSLLQQIYPNQVGLVHGKMKSADKDTVIEKFLNGEISILVATTVIEVGVNVPQATVMIIETAERFGLSQLHQLRGRVGRGERQASCILVYKTLNPVAIERLSILRETEDGFLLAEKDLELRGAGDILGTKQTGTIELPAFDFEHHSHLIKIARDDARYILETDPEFQSERGKKLRVLMEMY